MALFNKRTYQPLFSPPPLCIFVLASIFCLLAFYYIYLQISKHFFSAMQSVSMFAAAA